MKKRRRIRREIGRGRKARDFLIWLSNLSRDTENLPDRYIYVPLHFQPEMTTAPQAGVYGDQALAIEQLAASLPEGFEIVVKENPKQGGYHREMNFTDRLRQLDRVRVMHPSVPSPLLAERATIIAAITGTAGTQEFLSEVLARSREGIVYEFFLKKDDPEFEAENQKAMPELLRGLLMNEVATTFA